MDSHQHPTYKGECEIYLLPACSAELELLDTPILPEHLARSHRGPWLCSDSVDDLAFALDVDFVLMDLRAGLSEISSPVLFDPRVERIHVTTVSEQSIRGTGLALRQVGELFDVYPDLAEYHNAKPSVLLTMLTPELREARLYDRALNELAASLYFGNSEEVVLTDRDIHESEFHQELLAVSSWDDAADRLSGTSVLDSAREFIGTSFDKPLVNITQPILARTSEALKRLTEVCQTYEYAESGHGEDLLATEPLRNLAKTFANEVPRAVSLGSKGAGKTFNYMQIARSRTWRRFVERVGQEVSGLAEDVHVFPFLQPKNLEDPARDLLTGTRTKTLQALGIAHEFIPSDVNDRIADGFKSQDWTEADWVRFWVGELSMAVSGRIASSVSELNDYLKQAGQRVLFLFDGIEDAFRSIETDVPSQLAISALLSLPDRLGEIRERYAGCIIFIRRDYVRFAIKQNRGQFESLYRPYDLSWDADSFLRLVYWICATAEVASATRDSLKTLGRHDLLLSLEALWGKKLGADTAREANAANWVYAALTDFNGRLQARDIVRFLLYSASIASDDAGTTQLEYWQASRLLPPTAVRRALEPCSRKKVDEAKEEYPAFRQWIDELLSQVPVDERRIPFTPDQFHLDQKTLDMLREMGVIFDDRGKDDVTNFYMPEIFRAGLGFSLDKGARPRVLVLKKKALGPDVLLVD